MAQAKKNLVIVESPAKARTVASILGSSYEVKASIGHVRDLPKSKLGVDVEHGFTPQYIVPKEKSEVVNQIKKAAKGAAAVFLATDPDREGEAISWHLLQAADLAKLPHRRVVFHEITRDAIKEAFEHPRDIDVPLVDAYQARRVLDRLVGYKISPLLWNKVRRGLSAGRVQSVALRMVVDREREIEDFTAREYWTIEADLAKRDGTRDGEPETFRARLQGYAGRKRELALGNEEQTQALLALLRDASYAVADVRQRSQTRRPAPPFTTSTLQQEASRRLGFTAKRTMTVAQQLYEGKNLGAEGEVGLNTYMRTDSTAMAEVAKKEIRAYIEQKYGAAYRPKEPRSYTRKAKGAQEAHEAIRPTSVLREPARVRRYLTPDQQKLYQLIWQRAVASQMADALFDVTSVDVHATAQNGETYLFRASASKLRFAGFRAVYFETREDGTDEDAETRALPELAAGEGLDLQALLPEQHFTEPPARFTEATLVKALEENGLGRPSTYATILSTIMDRGYVEKTGKALRPTQLGRDVNELLTGYFPDVVDLRFTAHMEEELDDIAAGERQWSPVVQEFYLPLRKALAEAEKAPALVKPTDEVCERCGKPMGIKWGRFGQFLACTGYPECTNSRPLAEKEEAQAVSDEFCPLCQSPMVVKTGRFGRFLACARYPECKGTKTFLKKIGVPCPLDDGAVVERRTKGRRVFYGCSNYPRCD
ncbi:MAG TPA: type I DNA topoisomerase, partial [Dehalococcoidia bacterium]|nr:type I DNA topoisomerase [Dehalococcoidia bacterium]